MSDCFKIRSPNAAATIPADETNAADPVGYFRNFSACDSDDGTVPNAEWFNNLIINLESIVAAAGLTGDEDCNDLIARAIAEIAVNNAASAQTPILVPCEGNELGGINGGFQVTTDGFVVFQRSGTGSGSPGIYAVTVGDVVAASSSSTTNTANSSVAINGSPADAANIVDGAFILAEGFGTSAGSSVSRSSQASGGGASASASLQLYCPQ